MKVSFDGLRKNIARAYNDLAQSMLNYDDKETIDERMDDLRSMIGGLLAVYIPDDPDGDCNNLADDVKLIDVAEECNAK